MKKKCRVISKPFSFNNSRTNISILIIEDAAAGKYNAMHFIYLYNNLSSGVVPYVYVIHCLWFTPVTIFQNTRSKAYLHLLYMWKLLRTDFYYNNK